MSTICTVRIRATFSNVEWDILFIIIVTSEVLVGVNITIKAEDWLLLIFNALVEEVVEHLAAETIVSPVVLFLRIFFNTHHISLFFRGIKVVNFVKPHRELTDVIWSSELLFTTIDVVFVLINTEVTWPEY